MNIGGSAGHVISAIQLCCLLKAALDNIQINNFVMLQYNFINALQSVYTLLYKQ